jgi:hypothetical protein
MSIVSSFQNNQVIAYFGVSEDSWYYYGGVRMVGGVSVSRGIEDGKGGDTEMILIEDVGVTLETMAGYTISSTSTSTSPSISTIFSLDSVVSLFSIGSEVLSSAGNFASDIVIPETTSTFYLQENKENVVEYEYV